MNKIISSFIVLYVSFSIQAQGFVNLNFNSANIPGGTTSGSFVAIANAIPGWTGYVGTGSETGVLYNAVATGAANLAILSTNSPGAIPGNAYTVILQAGFDGPPGYVSTSIAQTAVIPLNAESITFEASVPYSDGWQVSIAGQDIPVSEVSVINNDFGVFAGNVSVFAGQDDQLEFTALGGSPETVNMYLDSISFSSNPVPEPGVFGLSAVGGLMLACGRWRKTRK